MKSIRIRLAEQVDQDRLIAFIRDHWNSDHVFVAAPELFDWQYCQSNGRVNMFIAEDLAARRDSSLLGVLGFIPMGRFDPSLGDEDICLALWKVREDVSPPGIGLQLLKTLQRELKPRIIAAIGISDIAASIYAALGYKLDQLCHAAIMNPSTTGTAQVAKGVPSSAFLPDERIPTFSLRKLNMVADHQIVSDLCCGQYPRKSSEYILHRFIEHPWYRYECRLVHREGIPHALLIWRTVEVGRNKILRIVDALGSLEWLKEAALLLHPVLVETGAEYIDIVGYGLPPSDMKIGGFVSPDWCDGLVLPGHFAPFEAKNIPIRICWKRFDGVAEAASVRLYRGDSDQDRPNDATAIRSANSQLGGL